MSVWTTKALNTNKNYIVLQHSLKGVNYTINGVKFRDSYAVVEKDSKVYYTLKKIPVLKSSKEYPLTYLIKLPFITRTLDIKTVYGQDVYRRFLEELKKEKIQHELIKQQEKELAKKLENEKREEELKLVEQINNIIEEAQNLGESEEVIQELKEQLPEITKCCYRLDNGMLCGVDALDYSPSKYCHKHILEDPELEKFGITVPRFLTRDEKRALRNKIEKILTKNKDKF